MNSTCAATGGSASGPSTLPEHHSLPVTHSPAHRPTTSPNTAHIRDCTPTSGARARLPLSCVPSLAPCSCTSRLRARRAPQLPCTGCHSHYECRSSSSLPHVRWPDLAHIVEALLQSGSARGARPRTSIPKLHHGVPGKPRETREPCSTRSRTSWLRHA